MVAFLISRQNISYWTFIQAAGHIFYSFTGAIKRGQVVGERNKKLANHEPEASNLELFECSPNIPNGLLPRYIHRDCSLLLL